MREGALALGRLLGAPPGAWGLPGPGPGPQPSSDEPYLQGWVVAADAPTGFQRVQPLLQAAD